MLFNDIYIWVAGHVRGIVAFADTALAPDDADVPWLDPTASRPTAVPADASPPVVSGTPDEGYTLTASVGSWSNSPTSYAYQWSRGGSAIIGATSPSYVAADADAGFMITCTVTASNALGSSFATSAPVGPVTAAAPTVVSATVSPDGVTFTAVFSVAVACSSSAGVTFTDFDAFGLTYADGSGMSTLQFSLGSTVDSGDTCTWSYSSGTGNITTSGHGNAQLGSFSNASVTNISTQGGNFSLDFSQTRNSEYINVIW